MNLVGYGSDSDNSGTESKPQPTKITAAASANKPAFQKLGDGANSSKIRVSLPAIRSEQEVDTGPAGSEPPAKRLRRGPGEGGGGLFSGMSSFLPAPKKPSATIPGSDAAPAAAKKTLGRGLGSGISLKTGAAPAFSREQMSANDVQYEADGTPFSTARGAQAVTKPASPEPEVKTVGQVTMFRPLSVGRKPGAKKKVKTTANTTASIDSASATSGPVLSESDQVSHIVTNAPANPKTSLFSMHQPESRPSALVSSQTAYQPMMTDHIVRERDDESMQIDDSLTTEPRAQAQISQASNAQGGSQSLQDMASDLKLSDAARRQLFGRKGRNANDMSAVNVVQFNTDSEYAANEEIRAKGETITHQPVRGVNPGKHSLKQLINTAVTQKDALEESFAQGQKNRKEAGNRYGW